MKRTLLLLVGTLLAFKLIIAQSPPSIPYQAVARSTSGNLVANQSVTIQFSIHNLTSGGTVVYREKHTTTTNKLGLFTVNLGQGTPLLGTFASIDWSSGNKFLEVEFDPAGGTSYTNMGTTQMMSVPFALYAASGGTGDNWGGQSVQTQTSLTGDGTTASKLDIATTGVANGTYNNVTVNTKGQVTAGSNVAYLTSEVDGSVSNEGSLTTSSGGGGTALIHSNTSGSTDVTLAPGSNITLSESGNTITIASSNPGGTVTSVATGTGLTGGPVTGSGTISIANNGVGDAQLRQGAATSVIGRSAASTGNVADIAASADGQYLRRSGGTLGFGSIASTDLPNLAGDVTGAPGANTIATSAVNSAKILDGSIATADLGASQVTYAKIQNVTASRLLGNPTGSAAAPSEISLGTGLSFSGSTLNSSPGQVVTTVSSAVNTQLSSNNTGSYANGTGRGWTIGTWQDVAGLSITRTVPAGKYVVVSFAIDGYANDYSYYAPQGAVFRIVRDGSTQIGKASAIANEASYYYYYNTCTYTGLDFVSDGASHTWKVQYYLTNTYSANTESYFIEDRNITIKEIAP